MQVILIVDDEASFLASIAEGLSAGHPPYRILTAGDGREAIALLETTDVAVVMTDLKMPVVDGFELLAWLATNRPATPVIVMTAFGTPTMEDQVVDGGAMRFIEKPFDVTAARRAVGQLIEERERIVSIGITDLVRVVVNERRPALIRLGFALHEGSIAVHDGQIVGATLNGLADVSAAAVMAAGPVTWFAIDVRDDAGADELRAHIGLYEPGPPLRLKDFLDARLLTAPAPVASEAGGALVEQAMSADGALAAALVDIASGATVCSSSRDALDFTAAATDTARVLSTQQRVLRDLGITEPLEDFVTTSASLYHVARVLSREPHLALYVMFSRKDATLASARLHIAELDRRHAS